LNRDVLQIAEHLFPESGADISDILSEIYPFDMSENFADVS